MSWKILFYSSDSQRKFYFDGGEFHLIGLQAGSSNYFNIIAHYKFHHYRVQIKQEQYIPILKKYYKMKVLFLAITGSLLTTFCFAQNVYQIRADSVRIYNTCDTAELILENRTQDTLGFLYNKGKGRTEFRKIQLALIGNEAIAIPGQDTLELKAIFDKFQYPRVTQTDGRAIRITDMNTITRSGWYYLPSTSRHAPIRSVSIFRKNVYFYASRERDSVNLTDMIVGSGVAWFGNGQNPQYVTPVHFVFNPSQGSFDSSLWKTNLVSLQAVTDEGNITTSDIYSKAIQVTANREVSRRFGVGGPNTNNVPYLLNRIKEEHPRDFPTSIGNIEWVLSGFTFDTYKNTGNDSDENKYGLLAIRGGIYDRHAATVGQLYNFGARAGTSTKPVAQFTQGSLLATPLNGAWEFDGSALYFTIGGMRREVQLASTSSQSASLAVESTGIQSTETVDNNSTDTTISILLKQIEELKERVSQLEGQVAEN
jgi:hypothetical protein